MTTFSSLSAFFLTITLVGAGAIASVEAAPAGKRELRQAKRASALAVEQPMVVAQATTAPTKEKADRQERRAKRMARFDSNGDGQIDPAERLAKQKLVFAKLDANGDQAISLAELQAAKEQRRLKRANKLAKKGKGQMHEQRKHKDGKSHLHRMDKGKRMERRFARLDSDKNGSVTWQEFSAAKQNKGFGKGRKGMRNKRF